MATYLELHDLVSSPTIGDLRKRLRVAMTIKANAVAAASSPTSQAREWARAALRDPQQFEEAVLRYVVAANASATVSGIASASDAQVQTAVNTAVDTLFGVA
jgi:hypothetical protein